MKALIALLAALAVTAQAQNVSSVEQADAALVKVAKDRVAINDEFAASERECSAKFFVNNCLDKAKEKRRVALAAVRAAEVDAQHFKRADSVAKRDAELAERARKDDEENALRTAQPPKPPHEEKEPPKAPTGVRVADREAQHEAKLKRREQQEAADAAKRAANVEAFERKKAESERRQVEVARKKAESEAKAEKKKADAEKASTPTPTPAPVPAK